MTNWIEWNGGECPIKSDRTMVECKFKYGGVGKLSRIEFIMSNALDSSGIIAYRITEDHEPKMTREQITAQIEALQKQLDALNEVTK